MQTAAVELLEKFVRERTRTLRLQVKRCRKQFSEEAVHDLRVAMRRLLALMDFLAFFAPSPALRKARRDIKSHLDAFDSLRDTQVMLLETSKRLAELPAIELFHRHLQKQEKRLLRQAQKDIANIKDTYVKALRGALKAVVRSEEDIFAHVDEAYQTVLHRLALIDPSNTATIHRVRIAFKRFRYSVEVVRPLLPTMPDETLERLHDYQTLMGEIQDMEVMLQAIDAFAARAPQCALDEVKRYYQAVHEQRVQRYLQQMNEVYSFWRTNPERPLPWEVVQSSPEPIQEEEETVPLPDNNTHPEAEAVATAHHEAQEEEGA